MKRYKDIVAKGTSTASESQAIVFVAEREECGMVHPNIRISHRLGYLVW
jgi:hypothetical protein